MQTEPQSIKQVTYKDGVLKVEWNKPGHALLNTIFGIPYLLDVEFTGSDIEMIKNALKDDNHAKRKTKSQSATSRKG